MMDEEYNSRFCKEDDCLEPVDTMVDKSVESITYSRNKNVICLYPSIPGSDGRCNYHRRKKYYADFFQEITEERKRRNKNNRDNLQRHLFRMGGGR